VQGNKAMVAGAEVTLPHGYTAKGRMQIGIRPEFLTLTRGEGLPFTLRRVEDVGRHRIVRGDVAGTPVNIIADEGAEIGTDMTHVQMQGDKINVYADDWRVEGAV
jgi:glycerol transport system ATP-binding protein